jgi:hypothetical protein
MIQPGLHTSVGPLKRFRYNAGDYSTENIKAFIKAKLRGLSLSMIFMKDICELSYNCPFIIEPQPF